MTHARAHGWIGVLRAALVVAASLGGGAVATADDRDQTRVVEIALGLEQFVAVPGATDVVVLEEAVCRVEIVPGGLRLVGLARGESIVFVWRGATRAALLVRVTLPPPSSAPAELSHEQRVLAGEGQLSTVGQFVPMGGEHTSAFQHRFDWAQQVDGRRVAVHGQATHSTVPGVPFNLAAVSLQYDTPRAGVTLLDFSLGVNGTPATRIPGMSPFNAYAVRGADMSLTHGANRIELFAGTTVPSYYRSLQGTRSMAGVNVERRQSVHLTVFGTSAVIGVPPATGANLTRQASAFQTAGFTYRFSDRLAAQATGGASTHGLYADGGLSLESNRFSLSMSGVASAPEFPLNQLQLLATGASALRAAATWKAASRVTTSMAYQQSRTDSSPLVPSLAGRSQYFSPTVAVALSRSQSVVANGLYSVNDGDRVSQQHIERLDLGWNAQWLGWLNNSIRATASALDNPASADRRIDLGVTDTLNVHVRRADVAVGFQNLRQDPSIVSRLRQQLGLLSVEQQQQFLNDPVSFAQAPNLPPELASLLNELHASDTEWSVSGQFQPTRAINLSLSYRFLRNAPTALDRFRSRALGYVVTSAVTPRWQLYSSITDTLALDARAGDIARTSVLLVGLTRTVHGAPAWLTPSVNQRTVRGRLFVDRNVNGADDEGEPGMGGRTVVLDDGRRTTTDAAGRFQFARLAAGEHRVSVPLDQFREPVRVTTPSTVTIDTSRQSSADVAFGVVNFSRVVGAVYNDYGLDRTRHADSPGLPRVALVIKTRGTSTARRIESDGSGEYRVDDLDPGSYEIEVDPSTIPANYAGPDGPIAFDVQPTRTVVLDVPLRALRAVAGYVLWTGSPAAPATSDRPQPLAGVTVSAGRSRAVTDANGHFILRDLPAGDVTVTLVPVRRLPDDLAAPSGQLRMPYEPTQIDNASVVIRRRDLVEYLKPQ